MTDLLSFVNQGLLPQLHALIDEAREAAASKASRQMPKKPPAKTKAKASKDSKASKKQKGGIPEQCKDDVDAAVAWLNFARLCLASLVVCSLKAEFQSNHKRYEACLPGARARS